MLGMDARAERAWPERAMDLGEQGLESLLHSYDLVVIHCWVARCKYSKRMMPVFDGLAKEFVGKAVFGKIDAQEQYHIPVKYKVNATPTFLIFKKGRLVDRLVGEMGREELALAVKRQFDVEYAPAPI